MELNWEAIGVIVEIVATLTIVITLIFVVVQIRVNSQQLERTVQATRTQNWQSVCENFNTWRQMVLMPDNADLWVRGLNNLEDLNRNERISFNMIAGCLIWCCWFMYHLQLNEGLMGDANNKLYRDLYKHPGYREWLLVHHAYHSDDFGTFLDEVCKSVGSERLKLGEPSSLTAGIY